MPQEKLLMKNIDRFDHYIASVDHKAAFLVTFNTFVLGTLFLKYNDIINLFRSSGIQCLGPVILIVLLLVIIGAIFCAFNATKPYLESGNETGKYISMLFFGSVATMKRETYMDNIIKLQNEDFIKDLAIQSHVLALGLENKFKWINRSKRITVYGTLFTLGVATLSLVINY